MSRLPHHALRFVGMALLVFAGLGLWYNGTGMLTGLSAEPGPAYFLHAFYTMSAVCVICYLALVLIGLQFIRLRTSWVRLFVGVVVFEVMYFICAGFLWLHPGLRLSTAMGSIANFGLMLQFVTLFPVWGPLLACWAQRRIEAGPGKSDEISFPSPDEQIAKLSDWAWAVLLLLAMFFAYFPLVFASEVLHPGTELLGRLVPILTLITPAGALWSVRLRRKRRRHRAEQRRIGRLRAGLCPRCMYSLRGLPAPRCPECGAEFDPDILTEQTSVRDSAVEEGKGLPAQELGLGEVTTRAGDERGQPNPQRR